MSACLINCLDDFNPRPPRGGRHRPNRDKKQGKAISIHAPREGGDCWLFQTIQIIPISIHAPREGGDDSQKHHLTIDNKFQSTPPARGATTEQLPGTFDIKISIHAPREGGDDRSVLVPHQTYQFQSTPPARGATKAFLTDGLTLAFQSTPPARGATIPTFFQRSSDPYFNPRPPRGGRPC